MSREAAVLSRQTKDSKSDGRYISVHKLRHLVNKEEKQEASDDLRRHGSRRISGKVSKVQRKISAKELRRVMDEEPAPTASACKSPPPKMLERKYATNGNISASHLFSLIEKRTNEKRRNLVKRFVSALTLHGYAQFHEASGIRKILWALILTTMVVFIVRLTYLSYRSDNYYKQIIEFETEKVYKLDFPTITICSYIPTYTEEMYKRFPINISRQDFKRFYRRVISNRGRNEGMVNQSESNDFESQLLQQLYAKGYKSYIEVLELFEKHEENDINSVFVREVMKREKCVMENKPCNFENLFKTVYRQRSQSLCKQFNSYKIGKHGLVSTGNDRENGLSMFWDISGDSYFNDTALSGILIEIHPYGTPHHIIDHRRTIYLEPGVLTNIDIAEITTKRLQKPFKPNCDERQQRILKDHPYSKALCELECFLEEALRKCGCIPDQFAEYARHVRACNITEMRCTFETSAALHCHECPVRCDENDYKILTCRLGIGNDWIYEAIRGIDGWKNKSNADIKTHISQNIVGFRVGFQNLEKQVRTYKEAVTWHDRISMLGGLLGLLLGFSVISAFELLFFLFDYLYITIRYRCTKEYLSAVFQQDTFKIPLNRRMKRRSAFKQTGGFIE